MTTSTGRYVMTLRATVGVTAVNAVQICYQPNGESYLRIPVAAGPNPPMQRQTDVVTLTIARRLNGTLYGTPRRILLGPGEQPWEN